MWFFALACSPSPPPPDDHAFQREAAGPVRFVALGDAGKANTTQHEVAGGIAEACEARGCDFALYLGDNLYPDGMTQPGDPRMDEAFTDVYGGLDFPFYAVLGNHDYGRQHQTENARYQLDWAAEHDQFQMPRPYYRFRSGTAAFWAVDTDAVFWNGEQPQADWLDDTLGPVEARWKVVFGHHPWRSNGDHGNAGAYEGWQHVPYASGNALRSFFEGHVSAADLYLSGHDHNLQSLLHGGTELVVSGAGASARGLIDRGNTLRAGHDVPGFAWIELGDTMHLVFYDAAGEVLSERRIAHPRAGDAGP